MPEAASAEFWRDQTPASNVFQPDALVEVYRAHPPTEWYDILMATDPACSIAITTRTEGLP